MPIILSCPSCKRKLSAKDEKSGQRMRCPACLAAITVSKENHGAAIEFSQNEILKNAFDKNFGFNFTLLRDKKYTKWIFLITILLVVYFLGGVFPSSSLGFAFIAIHDYITKRKRLKYLKTEALKLAESAKNASENAETVRESIESITKSAGIPTLANSVVEFSKKSKESSVRTEIMTQLLIKEKNEIKAFLIFQEANASHEVSVNSANSAVLFQRDIEIKVPKLMESIKENKILVEKSEIETANSKKIADEAVGKSQEYEKIAKTVAIDSETPSLAIDTINFSVSAFNAAEKVKQALETVKKERNGFKAMYEAKKAAEFANEAIDASNQAMESLKSAERKAPEAKRIAKENRERIDTATRNASSALEKAENAVERARNAYQSASMLADDAETPELAIDAESSAKITKSAMSKVQKLLNAIAREQNPELAEENAQYAMEVAAEAEIAAEAAEEAEKIAEMRAPEAKKVAHEKKITDARNMIASSNKAINDALEKAMNARKEAETIVAEIEAPHLAQPTVDAASKTKEASMLAVESTQLIKNENNDSSLIEKTNILKHLIGKVAEAADSTESALKTLKVMLFESPSGMYLTAQALKAENKYKGAVILLKRADKKRHPESQALLAGLYYFGIEISQDHKEAFRLSKEAADKNNIMGIFGLGLCYFEGNGTDKNEENAIICFRKLSGKWHAEIKSNYPSEYLISSFEQAVELYENSLFYDGFASNRMVKMVMKSENRREITELFKRFVSFIIVDNDLVGNFNKFIASCVDTEIPDYRVQALMKRFSMVMTRNEEIGSLLRSYV